MNDEEDGGEFGRPLIVVLNREPWVSNRGKGGVRCELTVGGVTTALDPLMQAHGGCCVAWGGGSADFIDGNRIEVPPQDPKYTLHRVELSKSDVVGYYYGFSNRCLWPLFHLFPEKAVFNAGEWKQYKSVNQKFADAVLEEGGGEIPTWSHDFQLALVPGLLREAAPRGSLAHFWHIPWVGWEAYNSLPWREEFMYGLLGADLLGFQTSRDVKHFLECAENLGYAIEPERGEVESECGRTVVRSFPIGVDYASLQRRAARVGDSTGIKQRLGVQKLVLSVDRLDYTKGIPQKLEAFQELLSRNPQLHGKVTLLIVATPSRSQVREYKEMRRRIEETIGHINGTYSHMGWEPVKYFYRKVTDGELLRFYRAADVAMITPLYDGMNLVAKEYVAVNDDGVLVLSEFAGAAEQMQQALLVNPYDTVGTAGALRRALEMPIDERRHRFKALRESVEREDVYWWSDRFLREWKRAHEARADGP